ncbi:hypothetical protein B296_00043580, partial [Ensete ventricosum]
MPVLCASSDPAQLRSAREDIKELLKTTFCHPILEIVALSGAHTLGRARPERSGWGKPETKYTGISIEYDPKTIAAEPFVAAKYSYGETK